MAPSRAYLKLQAGLSLLEVLITLLIMSIVSLLAWKGLDQVEQSSTRLKTSHQQTQALQASLAQLELDIQSMANLSFYDEQGRHKPFTNQAPLEMNGIYWHSNNQQRALYILQQTDDNQWRWLKWSLVNNQLFRDIAVSGKALPLAKPKSETLVMPNVTGFAVRAWLPARGWRDVPLLDNLPRAATGIEVTLQYQVNQQLYSVRKVLSLP